MKVKTLKSAMRKLKRVVPRKDRNMPILSYCKFNDGKVFGTNLERATEVSLSGYNHAGLHDKEPFLLNPYKVYDILRNESKSSDVKFQVTEDHVILEIDGIEYELFYPDIEDYPPTPEKEETIDTISKSELLEVFYDIAPFCLNSKDTTRLSLTGINFSEGKATATNGYYMAIQDVDFNGEFLLGDAKDIKKIRPTLKSLGDRIEVFKTNKNFLGFGTSEGTIFLTPIMEDFPEYEAVIPKHNSIPVKIDDLERLGRYLKKVHKLASDDNERVRWHVENGSVDLSFSDPEVGEIKASFENETYNNEKLDIAFKAKFIEEIIDKEEDLDIWLDKDTAGLFEGNRRYVLMPIHED